MKWAITILALLMAIDWRIGASIIGLDFRWFYLPMVGTFLIVLSIAVVLRYRHLRGTDKMPLWEFALAIIVLPPMVSIATFSLVLDLVIVEYSKKNRLETDAFAVKSVNVGSTGRGNGPGKVFFPYKNKVESIYYGDQRQLIEMKEGDLKNYQLLLRCRRSILGTVVVEDSDVIYSSDAHSLP